MRSKRYEIQNVRHSTWVLDRVGHSFGFQFVGILPKKWYHFHVESFVAFSHVALLEKRERVNSHTYFTRVLDRAGVIHVDFQLPLWKKKSLKRAILRNICVAASLCMVFWIHLASYVMMFAITRTLMFKCLKFARLAHENNIRLSQQLFVSNGC